MSIYNFPSIEETGGILPPHPSALDLFHEIEDILRPPSRIGVDEAARNRFTRIGESWERWSNKAAPYLVEPQKMITSRRYTGMVFCGPAQSLKTSALIENPIAHAITCHPRTVHVVQMDQYAAARFMEEKIEPMIARSPDLRERQGTGRGANTLRSKKFRGGCNLTVGWPVKSQLASRAIPLVLITDIDRMADDIEGEGDLFTLAGNRIRTFESAGMVVVESSPARPILVEDWKPATPHEAPPTTGILGLYNRGTRARLYWTCLHCDHKFEPVLDRLKWDSDAPSAAAKGRSAYLACPACGGVHEPKHKDALNQAAEWLHETDAGELCRIDEDPRQTDIVSYWMTGVAAALAPWRETVTKYLDAIETRRATNDEAPLRAVLNTSLAMPFRPRGMSAEVEIRQAHIGAKITGIAAGTAPAETRFLTVAVDVQGDRFVVQVHAWGPGLECWIIDRFDLDRVPGQERPIDPARYGEDWDVLEGLAERAWPVAETGFGLKPLLLGVDSHGKAGVTDKAYQFWRGRRDAGQMDRWHVLRGIGGLEKPRVERKRPTRANKGGNPASDVLITSVGTDRLKDEIATAITRKDGGQRSLHLADGLPTEVGRELAAERRTDKGWQKRPGITRNEALDLACYSLALALWLGAERADWDNPAAIIAPVPNNANTVESRKG